MKHIKKNQQIPTDYQLLLHLSDIQHWNKLPRTVDEMAIKYCGFYYCVYEDKKTVVVK